MGHALIGPHICFVNFVYEAIAFQKNAVINFNIMAPGASICCQIWKEVSASTQVDSFMQHAGLLGTSSDEIQLVISLTENVRLLSVKVLHLFSAVCQTILFFIHLMS